MIRIAAGNKKELRLKDMEAWLELAEESTVVRTGSPEMATAIGDFSRFSSQSGAKCGADQFSSI